MPRVSIETKQIRGWSCNVMPKQDAKVENLKGLLDDKNKDDQNAKALPAKKIKKRKTRDNLHLK